MGEIVIYHNNTFLKESRELFYECAAITDPNIKTFNILSTIKTIGEAVKWVNDNTDFFITLEESLHIEQDTVFLSTRDEDKWLSDYFERRNFEVRYQNSMYTVNSHVKYSCIYIVLCENTKYTGKDLMDIIVDLTAQVRKTKQEQKPTFTVKEKYNVIITTSTEEEAIRICKQYRSGKVYDENENIIYKTEPGKLPVSSTNTSVKRIKTVPNKVFQKTARKQTIK